MKNIIIILLTFLLSGCSNNDEFDEIQFDKESTKMIENGISVDASEHEITLRCYTESNNLVDINNIKQGNLQNNWITVNVINISSKEHIIKIILVNNQDANTRNASFDICSDRKKITISVSQTGKNMISVDKKIIVVSNAESSVNINCTSQQPLFSRVISDIPSWVSIDIKKSTENDAYTVKLKVNQNNDLGRIAKVVLESVDGATCQVCLRQEPRSFLDSETFAIDNSGKLDVLLGSEIKNIRNIRQLTISGSLNGCDLDALRKLFLSPTEKGNQLFPVTLDLSKCTLYGNFLNYYQGYGLESSPKVIENFDDKELPNGFLTNSANLVDVLLPENTETLGKKSLSNCISLTSIKIPDETKYLKYAVFQGCKNLENILIGKESNLLKIDGYVFNTGCTINAISLPECLLYINNNSFAASSVRELYVAWSNPPIISVLPNPTNCTLYVPYGSKEKYKSTDNWNRFSDIIELPYSSF